MKKGSFKLFIYVSICFLVVGLVVPFFMCSFRLDKIAEYNKVDVIDGYATISNYDYNISPPISLEGDYITYEGYTSETLLENANLIRSEYTYLPTANLGITTQSNTYEVYVILSEDDVYEEEVLICIPFVEDSVSVYVNGNKVERLALEEIHANDDQISYYPIVEYYDSSLDYQCISISVNEVEGSSDLFKRKISLSSYENYLELYKLIMTVEAFFFGMAFISAIGAMVYVFLYPRYSALTFINLFDAVLMGHCVLNVGIIPMYIANIAVESGYCDIAFRRFDLALLFLAGYITSYYFSATFKLDNDKYKHLDNVVKVIYLVLVVISLVNPNFISGIGLQIVMGAFTITMIALILRFITFCKEHKVSIYYIFLFLKTLLLGFAMFLNIVTINDVSSVRSLVLVLFIFTFIIHLPVRVIECRIPFKAIKKMNEELEDIVAQRTLALSETNAKLKEISMKDALTNLYNRFCFEKHVCKAVEEFNDIKHIQALHLCVFDMDDFKYINDTYGHIEGDEQLVELATIATTHLKENMMLARIGGEEFTILFIDYSDEEVWSIIEALRMDIEQHKTSDKRTTASFGICKAYEGISKKTLYVKADECLYESKNSGKNKITMK